MRGQIARSLLLTMAALFLASCAIGDGGQRRRERLVRDLADDAAAFNEAYAQAMTGQLLLNVLRARDRLPTQYLAMSSIQDAPTITTSQSFSLGSLNFGDVGSPWGVGEVSVGRDIERHPSYSLGPFASDDLRRVVFDPTEPAVFAEYWNAGWPKEVLLLLMADRVARIDHGAGGVRLTEFVNDAEDLREDCAAGVDSQGCDYVRLVRGLAQELRGRTPDRAADMSGVCGLAAAYSPVRAQPRRADAPECDRVARVLVGQVEYVVFLRSLDDIIYYLGELLRDEDGDGRRTLEAQIRIGAAGLDGGGSGVPLFRVVAGEARGRFAASVSYDGVRYSAGPAVARACRQAADEGPCRDDADSGDRSSQVLALLTQLLLRNQSDQSVPPPPTVLITQ
jgi:hypothetical protein